MINFQLRLLISETTLFCNEIKHVLAVGGFHSLPIDAGPLQLLVTGHLLNDGHLLAAKK